MAEQAARAAGDLVRATTAGRVGVEATKSSPTDVVTATDRAAEALLRELLLAQRPDDGVLGEEAGWEPGRSGLTWVVDPIDGTVNYTYGIPAYTISVAVVTGRPDVPGRGRPWRAACTTCRAVRRGRPRPASARGSTGGR